MSIKITQTNKLAPKHKPKEFRKTEPSRNETEKHHLGGLHRDPGRAGRTHKTETLKPRIGAATKLSKREVLPATPADPCLPRGK